MGMRWLRSLIAILIYEAKWSWLENTINYLCELEMVLRNHPNAAVRKLSWDIEKIPKGIYCYDGPCCPYLEFSRLAKFFYGPQSDGYCYYIGKGDFNSDTMILWDCCKCCGINMEEDIESEECLECNLEL